jgi:hypothetical protein
MQRNAIGIQFGIADAVTAARMVSPGVWTCTGRSKISRAAVAVRSERANGSSGILPMLRARQSIVPALGSVVHLAASAQGSCPSRARTESIVRAEPFASLPISANRNGLRFEFLRANVSVDVTCISWSYPGAPIWPTIGSDRLNGFVWFALLPRRHLHRPTRQFHDLPACSDGYRPRLNWRNLPREMPGRSLSEDARLHCLMHFAVSVDLLTRP